MPLKIKGDVLSQVIRLTDPVAKRNKGALSLHLSENGGRCAAVDSSLTMFVEAGFPISAAGDNGAPLTTGTSIDRLRGLASGETVVLTLPVKRAFAELPKIAAKVGRSTAKVPIEEPAFTTPNLDKPRSVQIKTEDLRRALAVATTAAAGVSTSNAHGVHFIASEDAIGALGTDGSRMHYAKICGRNLNDEPFAVLIGKQHADAILGTIANAGQSLRLLLWGNPIEWLGVHVDAPLQTVLALRCKPSADSILNWRDSRPNDAGSWCGDLNRDKLRESLDLAALYTNDEEPRCSLSLSVEGEQQIFAATVTGGDVHKSFDAENTGGIDVSKSYNVNYLRNAVLAVSCDTLRISVPSGDRPLWIRPVDGSEVECLVMPFAG